MSITAAMVMKLREITGAGMMECKKFLTATHGDIEQAIIEMRKAGQAKAEKKSDRIAAEGAIFIARSTDGRHAVMLEVNSETDFVSRDSNFTEFAQLVAETALENQCNDPLALSEVLLKGSQDTVEQARQALVAKIGENIKIRRIEFLSAEGTVGHYLHGTRIGVLVALSINDELLAKDIAMHVAASKPIVVNRDQVPAELLERERDIYMAQAAETGKPQDILDRMVEGRVNKFMDEVCLLSQAFVKNPDVRIEQLLQQKKAEVLQFTRFEVGEGIEKKEDNFVQEVMAQVQK